MPRKSNRKMKKQAKKTQKSPRPRRQKSKTSSSPLQLTECAAKYAIAIADPWNPGAVGACVPYPPARPSRKVTAFTRGIVSIGTAGFGFIAVSPSLINNFASIWHSESSFVGTTINATMASTIGVTPVIQANLPYSRDDLTTENSTFFTTSVQGRVVSCSISLKYIGTELNRGGRLICYSSPDHQSINGLTASQLGARLEAEFSTPGSSREKCWVTSFGISDEEFGFCSASPADSATSSVILRSYPFSLGEPLTSNSLDANYGATPLGAIITGVPGNQFEFEVVEHVEYIGTLAQASLSESSADADGLALVQTAAAQAIRNKPSKPNKPFKKVLKEELIKVGKEAGKAALQKGGLMLLSML